MQNYFIYSIAQIEAAPFQIQKNTHVAIGGKEFANSKVIATNFMRQVEVVGSQDMNDDFLGEFPEPWLFPK